MNNREHKKYTKIDKFSETLKKIRMTDAQQALVSTLLFEMKAVDEKLKTVIDIDNNVLLMPLLLLEGESSSLIEGTRTLVEDFAYDIEEMNNIPQWETRNLLSLYEAYIFENYYSDNFEFSQGAIERMHLDLFKYSERSKFKMIFDVSKRVEKVQPGKVQTGKDAWNFNGSSNKIEDAYLVFLDPSLKIEYLNDMMGALKNKVNNKELLISDLIISHPIFEAIHPFNDGNGRIGRLLLSLSFKILFKGIKFPIFLSEAFHERKEDYQELLRNVQLKNDYDSWNKWISFFIDSLIFVKRRMESRANALIKLWSNVNQTKAVKTEIRKEITSLFFKYFKLNKKYTIDKIKNEFPNVSVQTIYSDWNLVVKELSIETHSDGYCTFNSIEDILRKQ